MAAAFWCVQSNTKAEKANVELQPVGVNYLPPAAGKLKASSDKVIVVQIPCYTNTKDIKKDEEECVSCQG